MPLMSHLGELRKCMLVIIITFAAATVVAYVFAPKFVVYTLGMAPDYEFIQTGVAELLGQYVKVALIVGVAAALPVAIWQIDRFLRPGLKKSENNTVLMIMIGGALLFFSGAVFCFLVVIPFTLQFFLSLNTIGIAGLYSVKEYFSYIVSFMVAFGVIFEMPVVAALLTHVGVLSPKTMIKGQRVVFVLCFIIGAVITPPDVVSQIMVSIPMIFLYEGSILLCRVVYGRRKKRLAFEGIDIEEEDKEMKEKRQSRWAAAKAKVAAADADKSRWQ